MNLAVPPEVDILGIDGYRFNCVLNWLINPIYIYIYWLLFERGTHTSVHLSHGHAKAIKLARELSVVFFGWCEIKKATRYMAQSM